MPAAPLFLEIEGKFALVNFPGFPFERFGFLFHFICAAWCGARRVYAAYSCPHTIQLPEVVTNAL